MAHPGEPAPAVDTELAAWPERGLALGALFCVFTYVFVANSWVGDDAYISFRVLDNFVHGYGLTYNTPERVQAYTHPLWLLLHVPPYLVTGEVFYTTLALSFLASAAALIVWFRALGPTPGLLLLLVVLSSKAFVDYTSSGLENPLSYLLVAVFFTRFLRDVEHGEALGYKDVVWYTAVASLAFVNRMDSVLLFAPPLAWVVIGAFRKLGPRALAACLIGGIPALAWLAFAIFYYGFALPNTYYAKVATGIPQSLVLRQGAAYFLISLGYDPITLTATALAVFLALRSRAGGLAAIGIGLLLSLLYTVWVGGDHMAGRFFSVPFFCAALVLVWFARTRAVMVAMSLALAAYNLAAPLVPIKSGPGYQQGWAWRETNGVQDVRGYHHAFTNLLLYNPLHERPDHEWFRQGRSFARGGERVSVQGSIGFFGFEAGPDRFVVDPNALSDPFLARLPVSDRLYFEFYVGHFMRDIPAGYLESCAEGRNLIADPLLHDFYDRLTNVTRGPLLSWSRFRDIWQLNVGPYRRLHEEVDRRRPTAISVPPTHERFRTDIGVRDYDRREVHTAGSRAGYVLQGPNIPLRAGHYEVRWVGAYTEAAPMAEVGFAEVWISGRLVAEHGVRAADYDAARRTLALIEFDLDRRTSDAEMRLYLQHGVKATVERFEIAGAPNDGNHSDAAPVVPLSTTVARR
jgi:arabinofuranosyltransferase